MPARPRRTFLILATATLAVFAALLFGLAALLRMQLRDGVLQREAKAIHAVARMEINQAKARMANLGIRVATPDVFASVLESSRLSGVLAVQLFDPAGALHDALPAVAPDSQLVAWWPRPLTAPDARFHADGRLEQILGLPPEAAPDGESTPLLEVVVPLLEEDQPGELGVARYWIDGRALASELRRMDASLGLQSAIAFVGGATLVGLLLAWTYRRLARAHDQLVAQSTDLARANQELDFAAKTGALGAISAHLIHGLKNPLAGLEGFVLDTATPSANAQHGAARQTAIETARRLRTLVNDVVSVLRDETSGTADYAVPVCEMLAGVQLRAGRAAEQAGVRLEVGSAGEEMLTARTANLASLVLANLIDNAIDASPTGSTVRLAARGVGGDIEFSVSDMGRGLPVHVRDALFRPVLSTKPSGGGIGLAISHRLARHAGGELSLMRSDSGGTVFRLSVPAYEPPARRPG